MMPINDFLWLVFQGRTWLKCLSSSAFLELEHAFHEEVDE